MRRFPAIGWTALAAVTLMLVIGFAACTQTPGAGGLLFNLPPMPTITTDVIRGVAPLTVQFNSDRSSDDGLIVSRLWDFGDGSTSQEISPQHTFTSTGDYTVTLTLTDNGLPPLEASRTQIIAVTEAPVAVISADPEIAASAPAVIEFDGSASYDPDGEIVEFQWDFGDGSREFMQSVTHVYASSGTYRAKLTVTDDKGVTGSSEKLIPVGITTPTIEIRVPPAHGNLKLTREHVNATQISNATHLLEVVGSDDGSGWGNAAVGDYLIFDPTSINAACRVTAVAVGGDKDRINVYSLAGAGSIAAINRTASVYWASNIVLSPESPLWIQAVYDVEPGVARFARAGIDRDRDQCDAQAVLYDLGNGAVVQVLSGHDERVNDVAFAPNGEFIATCSDDGTVRLYDAIDGGLEATYTSSSQVSAVAISPDSSQLALGQPDGNVVLTVISESGTGAITITFSRLLASHTAAVNDVAFSPDGTQLLSGANDRRAVLWSLADGTILRDSPHTLGVNAVAFSPLDPILVATGSEDGHVRLWNNISGVELTTIIGHDGPVNDLVFSPDGSALITASDDNTARAWSPFTGALVTTFSGHSGDVVAVAVSPDGATLITGSSDGTARVWGSVSAAVLETVQPCLSTISAVEVAPDGQRFLAGVAAGNDIQLDTDPLNGNDLNITHPQALILKNVLSLDQQDVEPGRYYLWAEIATDQTEVPVRAYAEASISVVPDFAATIDDDPPIIPMVNNQANVLLPYAEDRQIFDLGPLDTGDRLFLSLLSTPGFGEYYVPQDEFSVMVLDADLRIFAWYQALRSVDLFSLQPELEEFVLFTPNTKLVVGPYSSHSHYYVVADGGINVSVRIQRDSGLFGQRQQRVYVRFDGGSGVAAGNQPPRAIPEFDAADFNQFFAFSPGWDAGDTAVMRGVIMGRLQSIYSKYYVAADDNTAANRNRGIKFYRSDMHGPPPLPYQTIYIGGSTPDGLLGVADYVDPRNETTTGTAIVYATQIAESGITGSAGWDKPITSDPADLGLAIGMVAAHEIGHLLGLRNTDDSTDVMEGFMVRGVGDPTISRTLKGGTPAASPLVSDTEQVADLEPIGRQDAILLLRETVGEVN